MRDSSEALERARVEDTIAISLATRTLARDQRIGIQLRLLLETAVSPRWSAHERPGLLLGCRQAHAPLLVQLELTAIQQPPEGERHDLSGKPVPGKPAKFAWRTRLLPRRDLQELGFSLLNF